MSAPSASSVPKTSEEQRRAATAYLVWPLAFANMVRDDNAGTIWGRLHARQAFVFGLLAGLVFLLILAIPLVLVIANSKVTTGQTIAIYTGGLIADVASGVFFLVLAIRYCTRASRGELFAIPVVTPIVDTVFRLQRP